MGLIYVFEKDLDEDHEIGLIEACFGSSSPIYIDFIGYYSPYLISFDVTNSERQKVRLIQNISQINITGRFG